MYPVPLTQKTRQRLRPFARCPSVHRSPLVPVTPLVILGEQAPYTCHCSIKPRDTLPQMILNFNTCYPIYF